MYKRCVPVPFGEPADLVCGIGCRAACFGDVRLGEGSMAGFAWATGSCDGLTLVKDTVLALMWEAVAA